VIYVITDMMDSIRQKWLHFNQNLQYVTLHIERSKLRL
jgi:hypothetical protein